MCILINLLFTIFAFNISFNMDVFKVGSLNVNGARVVQKRASIYESMMMKHIDVLFLQETHTDSSNEADWRREWEREVVLSHKSSTSGGVGILFSKSFTPVSIEVEHVLEGRLVVVKAVFEKFNVVFLNVYAPTTGPDRVCFLQVLNTTLSAVKIDDFLFLGGDFRQESLRTSQCIAERTEANAGNP